jgi:SAM-dependent methyltransferase
MNPFRDLERRTLDYYAARLREHGDSARGADWKDEASRALRFELLASMLREREDFTILDVGCGTGALLETLRGLGFSPTRYVGIDLVPAAIDAARARFAGDAVAEFRVASIWELLEESKANGGAPAGDYVVSSGILNVKGDASDEEWRAYLLAIVDAQFALAGRGAAFNVLTSYVDFTAPHLYYCDPKMLFDHCRRTLSRFVAIRHDAPLYEFTAAVYREGFRPSEARRK